jgi:phage protein U
MMMTLGTFVFSLPTLAYQQFQRQMAWRHASSERITARPANQFLGPGEETIELSGVIAPQITGKVVSLDVLQAMADAGEPMPLVEGTGRVYGAYVILSLNTTRTLFFKDGAARRIDFNLSLRRVDAPAQARA